MFFVPMVVLGSLAVKRSPEDRELLVAFQGVEGFGCFHHVAKTGRSVPIMFSMS